MSFSNDDSGIDYPATIDVPLNKESKLSLQYIGCKIWHWAVFRISVEYLIVSK